jgi:hypothetical protein
VELNSKVPVRENLTLQAYESHKTLSEDSSRRCDCNKISAAAAIRGCELEVRVEI